MFQIDSEIVRSVYINQPNYKIEYNNSCKENICAIYFSSNDIYYPNNEEIFRKRIVEKNFFEWYNTRINARKHIFVRDIFKQWYLEGINAELDSPEKIFEWLKVETEGYEVVTVGSSAGGYSAVLYGSLLEAQKVIAFNAQFSLKAIADESGEECNPLVFKYKNTDRSKYFELKDKLSDSVKYLYFLSAGCEEDMLQATKLFTPPYPPRSFNCLRFKTAHHGIPFLKVALVKVLNMGEKDLKGFTKKKNHPIWFTIRMVGVRKTITGFVQQAYRAYRKRR